MDTEYKLDRTSGSLYQRKKKKWSDLLLGKEYGKITVIGIESVRRYKGGRPEWVAICRCTCGNVSQFFTGQVVRGLVQSCGELGCKDTGVNGCGANHPAWRGTTNIPGSFFTRIKRNAISRQLAVTMTIQEIQDVWDRQNGKCYYTGWPLEWGAADEASLPSLDRLDSSQGYTTENTVFACWLVNRVKNDIGSEAFIFLRRTIAANHSTLPIMETKPKIIGRRTSRGRSRGDKLMPEEVREIRKLSNEGVKQDTIARRFRKSALTIKRIIRGVSHKEVI